MHSEDTSALSYPAACVMHKVSQSCFVHGSWNRETFHPMSRMERNTWTSVVKGLERFDVGRIWARRKFVGFGRRDVKKWFPRSFYWFHNLFILLKRRCCLRNGPNLSAPSLRPDADLFAVKLVPGRSVLLVQKSLCNWHIPWMMLGLHWLASLGFLGSNELNRPSSLHN